MAGPSYPPHGVGQGYPDTQPGSRGQLGVKNLRPGARPPKAPAAAGDVLRRLKGAKKKKAGG